MVRPRRYLVLVLSLCIIAFSAGISLGQNPVELRVTAPSRMLNDKTLTLKAELFDGAGNIDWQVWSAYGTVSAQRVSDQSSVPITITYFEEHAGIPAPDSIRFYNGKGSVSFTLDNGLCELPGEIEVSVSVLGVRGSKIVTVLDDTPMRTLSGNISGDRTWGPGDGVIHLTGNISWDSGDLVIQPGTLVMIDPSVDFDLSTGRRIMAQGTEEEPIYFFPTTGPPGMVLPNVCSSGVPSCEGGTRHNPEAWGQIRHSGSASSVFEHVFFVGGGNGSSEGHTRPPMLRFVNSSSFELRDCVLADNPGKAVYGNGTGTYIFERTLITRCGHGTEFTGSSGYTLRILDTWYTGVGRGPGRDRCGNDCGFDGDLINPRSPGDILIKGCVLTDGGDEAIDGSVATITVENTIMYNVRDRAYTDDGGSAKATFRNCLIFGNGGAFGGSGKKILENTTVYGGGGVYGSGIEVRKSILWPQTLSCNGTFTNNVLATGSTNCDSSNIHANPEFIRTSGPNYDFNLQPTSPAIAAGPVGDRVGWLGFPTGEACFVGADCDDADACTVDICNSGACSNDPIVGCVSCDVDADCEREPECVGTCSAGSCIYGGSCDDGLSCTSNDACVGGFCVGEDDCPAGQACNHAADACYVVPTTLIFQQGVDGYSGTQDTYIFQEFPDQSYGDSDLVEWDGWESTSPLGLGTIIGLIRFEDIFGTGPGQIPVPGDKITSAVIEYNTDNFGDDGEVREAYSDWDEQVTWGGFGPDPGPDEEDYGPILALAPGAPHGGGLSTSTVDVTPSIRRWAEDPSQNKGWVLIPTGDNGSEFWSSEYSGDTTARPKLVVIYGGEAPLADVIRQPYLQKAAPTSMTIVWKTALATDSRVSFGTSPGVYDQTVLAPNPTTDHEVTLTGLTPDTTYYYEVGSADQFHAGGCADHYFNTPPPIGTPSHFRTWLFSDSGIHSVYQYRVRNAILNHAGSHPPDLIIHTGDVDQGTPGADDYTVHHFDVYNEVLSHTAMYPTVGNHDGYTSNSSSGSGPYFDAFVLPTAGECGGVASGTESYYSFDYANAHFVVLDSDGGNLEPDSPMLTWLEADLAAADQQWLIAYWHHPPYSFGSHNSNDGNDSGGRSRKMRETFVPVLEAGGVDLVFAGHSHILERSFLISGAYGYGSDPNYATPGFATLLADGHILDSGDGRTNGSGAYVKSPFLNEYEGTVYMTVSSGGETLDALPSPGHPVMYTTKRYYGSALIDINGNELTLEWIREDGARLDYFSIVKPCIDDTDCEDSRYCNGAATCDAGNCVAGALPCSGQLCNEVTDSCVACLADEDCDDGLFCNGAETCSVAGNCEAGVDPCQPGDTCNEALGQCEQDECLINAHCDDENPCTDEFCNAGTCEYSDNSQSCDDGDACTVDDVCSSGVCLGTPLVCDDGNVCTDDSCNTGVCQYVANSASCDDGNACTQGDVCSGELCSGAPVDCSGLTDACNVGVCNPVGGSCEAQPVTDGLACDDGALCTVSDQCLAGNCTGLPIDCSSLDDVCNVGVCSPASGLCEAQSANEGGTCVDGDPCTDNDVCNSGSCVGAELDCSHLDQACQVGVCDPGTGVCEAQPVDEGGACDDGDPCTNIDVCSSGECAGTAVDCSALDDACNVGVCNTGTGLCEAQPTNEGGVCDDGDSCTGDDLCASGFCGGTLVDCSGLDDACNIGVCNPVDGSCEAHPANEGGVCDDGDACTEDDSCAAGSCGGTLVDCSGLNGPCTAGVCNAATGECQALPVNEGGACDDGDSCTENDLCAAGACGGTLIDCSGLNDICNIGACNPASGQCEAQPLPEGTACDDGQACTANDSCASGLCSGVEDCSPGDFCDPEGECASPVELLFSNDGVYSGTRDTFIQQSAPDANHGGQDYWEWDTQNGSPAGQNYGLIRFDGIIGGEAERIPPGARVISAQLRLVVWDASVAPPAEVREALVDWDESTESWNTFGGEPGVQADELGSYVADAPLSIGVFDVDVTASVQSWAHDPADNRGWVFVPRSTNGVHVRSAEYALAAERPRLIVQLVAAGCDVSAECDDGLYCNGVEVCVSGVCLYGSPVDCDDGLGCTMDSCNESADGCDHAPLHSLCDDGEVCTDDSCDLSMGCVSTNNTAACNDGDACTEGDVCSAGICGGTLLDCSVFDDACNVGVCNPTDGSCEAQPANEGGACDDGDVCTIDDLCSAGVCGGTLLDCSSLNDVCNIGVCNPTSGGCEAQPANEGGSCDDGNACTTGDACNAGICLGGSDLICDDINVCTDDACDPVVGCVFTDNVVQCDDSDSCTEDDLCSGGSCIGIPVVLDEVEHLHLHEGTVMTWDDHGAGFVYDVASGTLAELHEDGSVFDAECLESGVGQASFTDPRPDPPISTAYYYIIRSRNECGAGTYGDATEGATRVLLNDCP